MCNLLQRAYSTVQRNQKSLKYKQCIIQPQHELTDKQLHSQVQLLLAN